MILSDFETHAIHHFTPEEIEKTGARVQDVTVTLFSHMEQLRRRLGRRIILLKNGLTTGSHKSPEHPSGRACDFYFLEKDGHINPSTMVYSFLHVGFYGIGVYWNGKTFSFHVDLRGDYTFWAGVKKPRAKNWKYTNLIMDPKQL